MFAYRIKTIINQDSSLNLTIQKPFVPFPAIKMRGQGDTAAEMVIKDRL